MAAAGRTLALKARSRVIGQRLGKPEVEKFNKEAEIIDYYMKHPPNEPLQTGIARPRHKLR